jgi:hypothetical protein
MVQELFLIEDQQLVHLQAGALLACAAVAAAGLRTLLQRYLDRALISTRPVMHAAAACTSTSLAKHLCGC